MDLLDKMNNALDYIEENLAGEIDIGIVAQKACCSPYNFQRMFSFITDTSLAEYIRRRRLTQAGIELQNSSMKVIDLAIKYGYDSASSFSRAFQAVHQVTPTLARTAGVSLKAYPKISFQISIKGDKPMDYRIESKEAFQMFGIEKVFKTEGNEEFPRNPHELWDQCRSNGEYNRLMENAGELPPFLNEDLCKIHGTCGYKNTGKESFPYLLCAFVGKSSKMDGYTVVDIPAQTWAIFPSGKFRWNQVVDVINSMNKRIFSEWLPTSGYRQAEGADIEVYGGDSEFGYVELWYPVSKMDK